MSKIDAHFPLLIYCNLVLCFRLDNISPEQQIFERASALLEEALKGWKKVQRSQKSQLSNPTVFSKQVLWRNPPHKIFESRNRPIQTSLNSTPNSLKLNQTRTVVMGMRNSRLKYIQYNEKVICTPASWSINICKIGQPRTWVYPIELLSKVQVVQDFPIETEKEIQLANPPGFPKK